jgi:hypothetical protein
MEENKYISFDSDDIIEALEDLYKKRTGETIDVRFDNGNNAIKHLRRITIKKSISSSDTAAIIEDKPNNILDIFYGEELSDAKESESYS